eukprot:gene10106-biopygen15302
MIQLSQIGRFLSSWPLYATSTAPRVPSRASTASCASERAARRQRATPRAGCASTAGHASGGLRVVSGLRPRQGGLRVVSGLRPRQGGLRVDSGLRLRAGCASSRAGCAPALQWAVPPCGVEVRRPVQSLRIPGQRILRPPRVAWVRGQPLVPH